MPLDAIIIGGGLFGSVIEAKLNHMGMTTAIIDAEKQMRGSKPAACLMKPSWFSGMGSAVYNPALELLDEMFGIQDLTFEVRATKSGKLSKETTVHWINPRHILTHNKENRILGRVEEYLKDTPETWVVRYLDANTGNPKSLSAHNLIVAAGIWTEKLTGNSKHKQVGQVGAAFKWKDHVPKPYIFPFAPYRQIVAFNIDDYVWFGDGTAIKQENWSQEHIDRSMYRMVHHFPGPKEDAHYIEGIRPYHKGSKVCLLDNPEAGLWVASGGAKNGTLAAGYCAHVISEALA
jgi:hypothetical protein